MGLAQMEMLHMTRQSLKGCANKAAVPRTVRPTRHHLEHNPGGSAPHRVVSRAPRLHRRQSSARIRVQTPTRDWQIRPEAHHTIKSTHTQNDKQEQALGISHERIKEKEKKHDASQAGDAPRSRTSPPHWATNSNNRSGLDDTAAVEASTARRDNHHSTTPNTSGTTSCTRLAIARRLWIPIPQECHPTLPRQAPAAYDGYAQ